LLGWWVCGLGDLWVGGGRRLAGCVQLDGWLAGWLCYVGWLVGWLVGSTMLIDFVGWLIAVA